MVHQAIRDCPHAIDGTCDIATKIAQVSCPIHVETCNACVKCPRPKRLNIHTMTLAVMHNPYLDVSQMESIIADKSEGFGTYLARTLDLIFQKSEDCGCPGRQDILDTWTIEHVEKELETIVDWLKNEAKQRKLPYFKPMIRLLIKHLIAQYKK